MRKPSTLDALFTLPRQGILASTFLDPDRWWYLSDLARHLRVHHATLQRELGRLVRADLLLTRRDGNRAYYRANLDSPVYPELRALMQKTSGLVGLLRDALQPSIEHISLAFIYGSLSRGTATAQSDVDLMIVGDVSLKELTPTLATAEHTLRRPINATLYTESELTTRLSAKSAFLTNVLDNEMLFIVGTQDELDRMAKRRARRETPPSAKRDRRPSKGG